MVEIERHEIGIEDSMSFSPDWKGGQQMGNVCKLKAEAHLEIWKFGEQANCVWMR